MINIFVDFSFVRVLAAKLYYVPLALLQRQEFYYYLLRYTFNLITLFENLYKMHVGFFLTFGQNKIHFVHVNVVLLKDLYLYPLRRPF